MHHRPSARASLRPLLTLVLALAVQAGSPPWLIRPAAAQPLRVVTWNISNYAGGRIPEIQTVVYGQFEGRSMRPDIILGQEFISQSAVDVFVWTLNNAPGSPGDWAAAPFINGPDTDSAVFYRTSRVQLLPPGVTLVAQGGPSPNHPRNLQRYDFRPVGYSGDAATIGMYSVHFKASTGSENQARRLLEAQRMVADALALPSGWHFLVGGDLNIYTSSEPAYREMVGQNPALPTGPFLDPIRTPGSWNNNVFFRFVHTQDPTGAGGMDDRFDQILLGTTLLDGAGFHYIGNPAIAYSTTTWDDPNHSYRAWGNDGSSFDQQLRIQGNEMVGPEIAQALHVTATTNGGHLPVFLDLRVPARITSDLVVDFGRVPRNAGGGEVQQPLTITNTGDVALWTEAGVADLRYTLSASAGFAAPAPPPGGTFLEPSTSGGNVHLLTMDTTTPGMKNGFISIMSDDPDQPVRVVILSGEVTGCSADWDGDGQITSLDISLFLTNWLQSVQDGGLLADFNDDGAVNSQDISSFITAWLGQVGGGC